MAGPGTDGLAVSDPAANAAAAPTGARLLGGFSLKRAFPTFILLFLAASVITTVAVAAGADAAAFAPLKALSKFFIVMAMAAIGLNTDLVKLVRSGAKPILMGLICWICIRQPRHATYARTVVNRKRPRGVTPSRPLLRP